MSAVDWRNEMVSAQRRSTFFAMLATVGAAATCWYGAVVLVLSQAAIATAYRRAKAWIDLTCGGLMIALGIRQAFR